MPVLSRLRACRVPQLRRIALALDLDPDQRWLELIAAIVAVDDAIAQERLEPEDWAAVCPRPNRGLEQVLKQPKSKDAIGTDCIQVNVRLSDEDHRHLYKLLEVGESIPYLVRKAVKEYIQRNPLPAETKRGKKR